MMPPGSAYRGSREPVVLLDDSYFHVRQLVPVLAPDVDAALHADPYAAPSTGGVDRDTEYAFCATAQHCYVWRATSAQPTCFAFPVPRGKSDVPPHCIFLPRPLNASAEPALLLCTADGQLVFWNAVSDAFTADGKSAVRVPLQAGEGVSAAARVDGSQVVLGTTHARVFCVRVYMHRGEHQLVPTLLTESRGLLGRWFGGSTSAAGEYATTSVVVSVPGADMQCLVLALSARSMQVWRVPVAMGAGASSAPRLVHADTSVHRTLASRVLYARGQRFSAADAMHIEMVDAAFAPSEDAIVVLYVDRHKPSQPAYGLALLDVPADANASLAPRRVIPLHFQAPEDLRVGARPRILASDTRPSTAFVSFGHAVVVQLLGDPCGSEETLRLRHGGDRILGACVSSSDAEAQWTALTAESGVWHVDFHVAHAQQQAMDEQPSSASALDAQTRHLQEKLESAVWFDDDAHPLQLDALPSHLDMEVLAHCVAHVSRDLLTSSLRCMPPTVDLRTQLAQRVACALRLRDVLGRNGYLAQLPTAVRTRLRADAALLAGASDLWRLYDAAQHASVLSRAIEHVLGAGHERAFFERALPDMLDVLAAMHAQLTPQDAVVCTRLVLALFLGASRFVYEHGSTYQLPPTPSTPGYMPWYASPVCIRLLDALFDAALSRLDVREAQSADAELRTQLCALAEQALNVYEAHEACLDHDDELAAAKAASARARPALLRPLLTIGRADKAFALAEQHRDFRTLVELCFADQVVEDETKRIRLMHPRQDPADVRVEHYLNTYGMAFASELYEYYIRHGALRRFLEPRPEHTELVSRFLEAHAQYAHLVWVHDTALGAYDHASSTLRACANDERLDVEAKQRMLSLGKLMHVAGLRSSDDVQAPAQQVALETWDDALDLGRIQQRLCARWTEAALVDVHAPPEAQAEAVAAAVAPCLDARPALRTLFVSHATDVMAGHVVRGEDMIDLLTLPDRSFAAPPDAPLTDYAMAVQVLVRLPLSGARREAALVALWRRLYLTDDWEALSDTTSLTDDQVLENVRNTVAFHTLQSVLAEPSTASTVMAPESVCTVPPPSTASLAERLQGVPDVQIEAIHAALHDEQEALAHVVHHTKLAAFYAHVLSVRPLVEDAAMDVAAASPDAPMPGATDMLM